MRYAIVIEKAEGNSSVYVPDLPGCVATGGTIEEVESQIQSLKHVGGMGSGLVGEWGQALECCINMQSAKSEPP